jgi:hypothetical protein
MYVVGYRTRSENEPAADPKKPWENIDVQFSPRRGDWLLASREWAQRHLDLLTSFRTHVEEHYCHFEIEEEAGTFAIVCRQHPEPTGVYSGSLAAG